MDLSWLRKRIETIGQEVWAYLDKNLQKTAFNLYSTRCVYRLITIGASGPIMIPPIPESKFMDKLDMMLVGQDGYEAEVKVYRYLENVNKKVIIFHQIDYTHEQYSAFIPEHLCDKMNCTKEPGSHKCHRPKKTVEGETDFLVLGNNFAVVLEVKGAERAAQIQSCCEDGLRQRRRMVNLIKSIYSCLPVYEFTVFSNISSDEVDETFLSDETLIFSEDLEHMEEILDCCEAYSSVAFKSSKLQIKDFIRYILGLWCINNSNEWDIRDCSLSKSLKDVDNRLRKAMITKRSIEEAGKLDGRKNKSKKKKMCPENPNIVESPDVFKEHLNIRRLTKDQLDIFQSKNKFLWVEAPAGSGKTITMLGKIIEIALNTTSQHRILLALPLFSVTRVSIQLLEILNNIREDISCVEINYNHGHWDSSISERTYDKQESHSSMIEKLSDSKNKIVLLKLYECFDDSIYDKIAECFDFIFVDDFQTLCDHAAACVKESLGQKGLVMQALLPVLKNSSTSNTSVWIFSDMAQSWSDKFIKLPNQHSWFPAAIKDLRDHFVIKELKTNLRNSFEIFTVLNIIRRHYESINLTDTSPVTWPQQEGGHFLRGKKPVIYLVDEKNEHVHYKFERLFEIVRKELDTIKEYDRYLKNSDIGVLYDGTMYTDQMGVLYRVYGDKYRTKYPDWQQYNTISCVSAEWAAVVYIYEYNSYKQSGDLNDTMTGQSIFSRLYVALSRARVYCAVILYDYKPNTGEISRSFDDLLEKLSQRTDVCRVIRM